MVGLRRQFSNSACWPAVRPGLRRRPETSCYPRMNFGALPLARRQPRARSGPDRCRVSVRAPSGGQRKAFGYVRASATVKASTVRSRSSVIPGEKVNPSWADGSARAEPDFELLRGASSRAQGPGARRIVLSGRGAGYGVIRASREGRRSRRMELRPTTPRDRRLSNRTAFCRTALRAATRAGRPGVARRRAQRSCPGSRSGLIGLRRRQ